MRNNKRFAAVTALVLALTMVFSCVSVNAAAVKKVTLKASTNVIEIGKTVTVKATPAKVTWKSSNKKVATVSSKGVVKGLKAGTATITATAKANKKAKKTIKITVVKELPVVDKAAKTVTINCKVNANPANQHWFIVNEEGSMAAKTVLSTTVRTDDFYTALTKIAGTKVWNNKKNVSFGSCGSIDDQIKANVGKADYAKFDVKVAWGGKEYKLSDVITNVHFTDTKEGHNGQHTFESYDGAYDIAFSGNLAQQRAEKTGCITCFGSCYLGITSGHDTPMMVGFTPANLPAAGETVQVIYTLK